MQALYSDQLRDLDDGYGLKYETAANHPHLFLEFAPWRGAREHFALMQAMSSTVPIGVLLRDRDGGEVRVGRDGEPVVRYKLSDFDADHLRTGIDGAAQILEAAGARRIFSSQTKWVGYDPVRAALAPSSWPTPTRPATAPARCVLSSFHIMGSARMGGSPASVGVRPDRPDLGGPRPVRARRLELSDRLGRQPADLDPGDRAHERLASWPRA